MEKDCLEFEVSRRDQQPVVSTMLIRKEIALLSLIVVVLSSARLTRWVLLKYALRTRGCLVFDIRRP